MPYQITSLDPWPGLLPFRGGGAFADQRPTETQAAQVRTGLSFSQHLVPTRSGQVASEATLRNPPQHHANRPRNRSPLRSEVSAILGYPLITLGLPPSELALQRLVMCR